MKNWQQRPAFLHLTPFMMRTCGSRCLYSNLTYATGRTKQSTPKTSMNRQGDCWVCLYWSSESALGDALHIASNPFNLKNPNRFRFTRHTLPWGIDCASWTTKAATRLSIFVGLSVTPDTLIQPDLLPSNISLVPFTSRPTETSPKPCRHPV
jgi:hypothetical protein